MNMPTRRQRHYGRNVTQSEIKLISRFGSEAAWLKAAERTSEPERWRSVLHELRPWEGTKPNLCRFHDGEIVLVDSVYIRVPDDINHLAESKIEKLTIDKKKNPLTDKTEWIYLRGWERASKVKLTYPTKRGFGQPRKKVLPF